jgi:hypothetical protein
MDYNFALMDKRSGVNKKLYEKQGRADKNMLVVKTLTRLKALSLPQNYCNQLNESIVGCEDNSESGQRILQRRTVP